MPPATPRLVVEGLTKRFGSLVAVDDVSLTVMPGELHCLLGENGAGKSTLSSCLYGLHRADAGRMKVEGRPYAPRSPLDAVEAGLGMVHQHFVLAPSFTALENIVVGTGTGWRLDLAAARRHVGELCASHGIALDLDRPVSELAVGERQWVEIVKALRLGARSLILDEPTAVLTPDEADGLFVILRRMTAAGLSVILITHKMGEVMWTDRVSVLRKGRLIDTIRTADTSRDELARMMMGRAPSGPAPPGAGSAAAAVADRVLLSVREVWLADGRGRRLLDRVGLELRAGEILGLAGVAGNGQGPLFETIAGLRRPAGGEIRLDGKRIDGLPARRIARLGLGHVPDDRLRDGLVPDLPVAENLILGRHWDRVWRKGPLLAADRIARHAAGCIEAFGMAAAGPSTPVRRLSGGNAQKVVLARELAKATRCLLCNQPTRGLDIGVVERVHAELRRKREAGVGVLLASEEIEDLLALADRIAVIFRGRILAVLPRAEADLATIGRLMAGHGGAAPPPAAAA
jgi:ABC-type uncharacterized transport system ATPase subunit